MHTWRNSSKGLQTFKLYYIEAYLVILYIIPLYLLQQEAARNELWELWN